MVGPCRSKALKPLRGSDPLPFARNKRMGQGYLLALLGICATRSSMPAIAQSPFQFPTANHALYEPNGEERFFVGTAGKPWTTGTFGCVRSGGWQLHEGLDIRCLLRDKHGEPADPVAAAADGTVVYISTRPALSNYGRYMLVRHLVGGLEY